MKKILILFGIVFFVSTNTLIAKTAMKSPIKISQYEIGVIQSELESITNHFYEEYLGIKSLVHFENESEKQCRVTITVEHDGVVISVTFVVEGKTCSEYLSGISKEHMK